jgi:mannose-6-phosphate isomerase-like protein (cupin superfamily)
MQNWARRLSHKTRWTCAGKQRFGAFGGFSFNVGTCDAGDVWIDHGHNVEEIVMLASGAIYVRIGDRSVDVSVGDEIVIPTGVDHEIRNVGSTPARILFGYATLDR